MSFIRIKKVSTKTQNYDRKNTLNIRGFTCNGDLTLSNQQNKIHKSMKQNLITDENKQNVVLKKVNSPKHLEKIMFNPEKPLLLHPGATSQSAA